MSDRTPLLVVDDEPPIRRLLRTSLGAEGFEVIEADNAEKALTAIEARKPEIVILDLGLPDQDGLDVIRSVR
ncbi:MAG: response regulator, partial [Rhodomicrobium sp.]